MDLNDLVVLQYSSGKNIEVVSVSESKRMHPDLNVDLEKEEWSYAHWTNRIGKTLPIGKGRYIDPDYKHGPIGVYDKRERSHLNNMMLDGIKAVAVEDNEFEISP